MLQHSPCSHDSFSRKDVDYDKNSKISPDSFLDERSSSIGNNLNDLKDDDEANTHNKEVKVTQKDPSNDQNQHIPLKQKYITTRKKKKKKKDHNEELSNNEDKSKQRSNNNNKAIDNNSITSPSKSKETVFILGDNLVKKVT